MLLKKIIDLFNCMVNPIVCLHLYCFKKLGQVHDEFVDGSSMSMFVIHIKKATFLNVFNVI